MQMTDVDFSAKRALYRTARIVNSDCFVQLLYFAPASVRYGYADFWRVKGEDGEPFSVEERYLTDFCL